MAVIAAFSIQRAVGVGSRPRKKREAEGQGQGNKKVIFNDNKFKIISESNSQSQQSDIDPNGKAYLEDFGSYKIKDNNSEFCTKKIYSFKEKLTFIIDTEIIDPQNSQSIISALNQSSQDIALSLEVEMMKIIKEIKGGSSTNIQEINLRLNAEFQKSVPNELKSLKIKIDSIVDLNTSNFKLFDTNDKHIATLSIAIESDKKLYKNNEESIDYPDFDYKDELRKKRSTDAATSKNPSFVDIIEERSNGLKNLKNEVSLAISGNQGNDYTSVLRTVAKNSKNNQQILEYKQEIEFQLASDKLDNNFIALVEAGSTDDSALKQIKSLLDKGANINAKNSKGEAALQVAGKKGLWKIGYELILQGAIVINIDDSNLLRGWSWLTAACDDERPDIVNILLIKGAKVNQKNGDKELPIYYAKNKAYGEKNRIILMLLELYKVIQENREFDRDLERNWTALTIASELNLIEIARQLIANGAVYNKKNQDGENPWKHAKTDKMKDLLNFAEQIKRQYWHDVYKYLLEKTPIPLKDINQPISSNWNLLTAAIDDNRLDVVECLLKKRGINVFVRDGGGRNPIDFAKEKLNKSIIEALKEKVFQDVKRELKKSNGKNWDLIMDSFEHDMFPYTNLTHESTAKFAIDFYKTLLRAIMQDTNRVSENKARIIFSLIQDTKKDRYAIFNELVQLTDLFGRNLLHIIAASRDPRAYDTVKILVENGYDFRLGDNDGARPSRFARIASNTQIFNYLIVYEALRGIIDINARVDDNNNTPLILAAASNLSDEGIQLLKMGAWPGLKESYSNKMAINFCTEDSKLWGALYLLQCIQDSGKTWSHIYHLVRKGYQVTHASDIYSTRGYSLLTAAIYDARKGGGEIIWVVERVFASGEYDLNKKDKWYPSPGGDGKNALQYRDEYCGRGTKLYNLIKAAENGWKKSDVLKYVNIYYPSNMPMRNLLINSAKNPAVGHKKGGVDDEVNERPLNDSDDEVLFADIHRERESYLKEEAQKEKDKNKSSKLSILGIIVAVIAAICGLIAVALGFVNKAKKTHSRVLTYNPDIEGANIGVRAQDNTDASDEGQIGGENILNTIQTAIRNRLNTLFIGVQNQFSKDNTNDVNNKEETAVLTKNVDKNAKNDRELVIFDRATLPPSAIFTVKSESQNEGASIQRT